MLLFLYLVGGREIRLEVNPDEWTAAFENALRKDEVVKIEDPSDGGAMAINPRQVLYWKVGGAAQARDPDPSQ